MAQGNGGIISWFNISASAEHSEGSTSTKGIIEYTKNSIKIKSPCIIGYNVIAFPAFP
jgi:hypothetical protein